MADSLQDMLPNIDVQLIPFASGVVQRETLYALYRLLLYPYIKSAFGWHESDQQARFATEHPNSSIKLIQVNNVLAGFLATRLDQSSLHINLLLIKPEFQGCGIGKQAMLQIQTQADAIQLSVTLSCFTKNHRALAFYQRLGYRIICSDEHFVDLTNA